MIAILLPNSTLASPFPFTPTRKTKRINTEKYEQEVHLQTINPAVGIPYFDFKHRLVPRRTLARLRQTRRPYPSDLHRLDAWRHLARQRARK